MTTRPWRCRLRHRWGPWKPGLFHDYRGCVRCGIEDERPARGEADANWDAAVQDWEAR